MVVLWVASGGENRSLLKEGNIGGQEALPRIMHPRATGVRLTRDTCDPEVVEIRTVIGQLFPC